MTTTESTPLRRPADVPRADRIADELDASPPTAGSCTTSAARTRPLPPARAAPGPPNRPAAPSCTSRATGEPRLLIHHVDAGNFARLGLDVSPMAAATRCSRRLTLLLAGARRVLMEYSPGNAIPYVSRVDAGTLELVRALGVEVLSSADALASVVAAWDAADSGQPPARGTRARSRQGRPVLGDPQSPGHGRRLDRVRRAAAPGAAACSDEGSSSTIRRSSPSDRTRAIRTTRPRPTWRCRFGPATWC